jgi:hypothetical protein
MLKARTPTVEASNAAVVASEVASVVGVVDNEVVNKEASNVAAVITRLVSCCWISMCHHLPSMSFIGRGGRGRGGRGRGKRGSNKA